MKQAIDVIFSPLGDGSLISENPGIIINDINKKSQSITMDGVNINLYDSIFEKYICRSLTITSYADAAKGDLSKVPRINELEQLFLELRDDSELFLSNESQLSSLRELRVLATDKLICRPDFKECRKLRRLISPADIGVSGEMVAKGNILNLHLGVYKEIDLSALQGFNCLQKLRVDSCKKIKTLDFVEELSSLESLWLRGCKLLNNANALGKAKSLRNIIIEDNKSLTDFTFLAHKPLISLSLGVSNDVDWMIKIPGIEFVYCKNVVSLGGKSFRWTSSDKTPVIGEKYEPIHDSHFDYV